MVKKIEGVVAEGQVQLGSGNVFADLGLPEPEERLAKAQIASAIQSAIEAQGLTQQQAAVVMEVDQPKVSKIVRGRLSEFSTEWLLTRLLLLGMDVEIIIHRQDRNRKGVLKVASL